MYQNQVQNKPTAAYWLSMIGGILGLLGGLVLVGAGAVVGAFTFGLGFAVIGSIGIWITICSAVVIYAATRLNAEPLQHSKWGAIILVFSIIGGWSILDFIGGILALVYQARTCGAQQPTGNNNMLRHHKTSTHASTTTNNTSLPTMRKSSAKQT